MNTTTSLYDRLIALAVAQGCDEAQVRAGSIPEATLRWIAEVAPLAEWGSPAVGVHVGTFVGVSLGYLVDAWGGYAFAVDPEQSHRGVDRPVEVAASSLAQVGLRDSIIYVNGYSLNWNLPNDGMDYAAPVLHRPAGKNALAALAHCGVRCNWVLLDGNHGTETVDREVSLARLLLRPGGALILDDIDNNWPSLRALADDIPKHGDFVEVGRDGRAAVFRKPALEVPL